jgi:hypothetical protein
LNLPNYNIMNILPITGIAMIVCVFGEERN